MPKLTKRFIDSLKPEGTESEKVIWDSELNGFGLRIRTTGRRTFIVQYRNIQGRTRKVTLGEYGKMTPEQARRMARQSLGEVAGGEDVAEERQLRRRDMTFKKLAERYMEEHAEPKKKAKSVKQDRRQLDLIIIPALGRRKVNEINRADVAKLQHNLRDTPYQANRVMALLSKMFNLAEKWGLRPDGTNPCRHVERYQEKKRERYLSGEEMARLGLALTEAEKDEVPAAILAIRLLLFTGARLNEILTLKWDYVELERGLLSLPDSKTGAKVVALPGPAVNLLKVAPQMDENPYVCYGHKRGGHLVGLQKIWERIRAKAELADVRVHDLRHSFASVAAANNMGLPIIGALLGHTQAQTTKRYAHLAMDPLKAASNKIAEQIDNAMKQKPKVVSIKRR